VNEKSHTLAKAGALGTAMTKTAPKSATVVFMVVCPSDFSHLRYLHYFQRPAGPKGMMIANLSRRTRAPAAVMTVCRSEEATGASVEFIPTIPV
jgi:hypothetical protein